MKKKKKSRGLVFVVLLLCGGGAVAWGASQGWLRPDEELTLDGAVVRRGNLRISEVVKGSLESKNSAVIRSEIERGTTIISLLREGSIVEVGDLVCELDVTEMEERRIEQEIGVKAAEADFTKAREQYDIQEIQNKTDIALAELALEFAKIDLDKYLSEDGEWTHEKEKAYETIVIKEEEVARAAKELKFTRELAEKGFAQQNQLEQDELSLKKAEVELGQAKRDKSLKETYEFKRRKAELEADVITKERDLEKTHKQAIARLADYEAARESAKFTLAREQEKLAKLRDQVGKGKLYAPESGILVYARKKGRWGQGDPIEEGTEVYERQEIATIPRPGGMTAEASLHETRLKKVHTEQSCLVSIEALPGKLFDGHVSFVAVLPDSGSYFSNPNQRVYRAVVTLDTTIEDMRPGMSCSIEILVEDLENVLHVPRQCVFYDGRQTVCFVHDGKSISTRQVKVGQDNNKWVVIEEGLSEGEVVLLTPPANFNPATREDDAELVEFPEADAFPDEGRAPGGEPVGPDGGRAPAAMGAGREGGERRQRPDGAGKRPEGGGRPGGDGAGGGRRGGPGGSGQ
jgi:HlyD family secretion protein